MNTTQEDMHNPLQAKSRAREVVMMHWWVTRMKEDTTRIHCAQLATPTSLNSLIDAFTALLRSDHTPSVGIALDYYQSYESMFRHGIENPFEQFDDEVLKFARQLLQQPPVIASEQIEAKEDGANHASALAGMMNLAEIDDADLIAQALLMATTSEVKRNGALAAAGVLEDADAPPLALIYSLESLIFDEQNSYHARSAAISALSESDSEAAYEVILRATHLPEIELQSQAAIALTERDFPAYQAEIERVIDSWPLEVEYPATKLLAMLREKEEDGSA
ncbi:HEAT repeat domain-containing protein [Streptomyces sp. NPDC093149]|uniref:HEAT repeat domain-containing protein n=1 Tax=Streptomyces sp. NPDC093149 TaxID=3366031 RepID=UPI00381A2704